MKPVVVVIPAFCPSDALVQVVAEVCDSETPVVIVNDGSPAAYEAVFERCSRIENVTVLSHPQNRGKGAALKTAIPYVLGNWPDCLGMVTADADGQHDPQDIRAIVARFRLRQECVLGVRHFGSGVPLRSRVGNFLTRAAVRVLIGHNLEDTQTGLRAIPRILLPGLANLSSNGYEFELEMLILCKHMKIGIAQHPIRTIYVDGNRSSHFNPIRDSLKIYFVLLRFTAVSLLTSLLDNLLFASAYLVGLNLAVAQALARGGAMVFNYWAARNTVFLSTEGPQRLLPAYLANVVVSGVVSYFLIRGISGRFGLGIFWSKVIAESLLFGINFVVQRDFVFVRRQSGRDATDWDGYYQQTPFFARFTRRYTSSVLLSFLRDHANGKGVIVEFGGANSCFIERVRAEMGPSKYHVIDSNSLGLDLLRQRFPAERGVILHQRDILDSALPLEADVTFSVGLVEHFDPTGTRAAVRAHFDILRQGGLAIISFPTPTALYSATRFLAELCGIWKFPDERPLRRSEILECTAGYGQLVGERTLWPLILTQHLMVFRREPNFLPQPD